MRNVSTPVRGPSQIGDDRLFAQVSTASSDGFVALDRSFAVATDETGANFGPVSCRLLLNGGAEATESRCVRRVCQGRRSRSRADGGRVSHVPSKPVDAAELINALANLN